MVWTGVHHREPWCGENLRWGGQEDFLEEVAMKRLSLTWAEEVGM